MTAIRAEQVALVTGGSSVLLTPFVALSMQSGHLSPSTRDARDGRRAGVSGTAGVVSALARSGTRTAAAPVHGERDDRGPRLPRYPSGRVDEGHPHARGRRVDATFAGLVVGSFPDDRRGTVRVAVAAVPSTATSAAQSQAPIRLRAAGDAREELLSRGRLPRAPPAPRAADGRAWRARGKDRRRQASG